MTLLRDDATQGTTMPERKTGATRGITDMDTDTDDTTDVDIEFVLIKHFKTRLCSCWALPTPPTYNP